MIETLRKSKLNRKYIYAVWKRLKAIFQNKQKYVPSEQAMEQSRRFFNENKERTDRIEACLADDLSKKTFRSVINARCTGQIGILQKIKEPMPEYFPQDIITLCDDEVFVDCGAFNGDTVRAFLKNAGMAGIRPKRVYAFEPAELSFKDLSDYANKINRKGITEIIPVNKGTWSEETTLSFSNDMGEGARVTSDQSGDSNGFRIQVTSIDRVCEKDHVTYIKMDVEGAESETLKGAKETIITHKPKLAVCLYHSDDDILRLIEYIRSIRQDYRFYIRHYGDGNFDTICYCV